MNQTQLYEFKGQWYGIDEYRKLRGIRQSTSNITKPTITTVEIEPEVIEIKSEEVKIVEPELKPEIKPEIKIKNKKK
jgi:hypothetical protein